MMKDNMKIQLPRIEAIHGILEENCLASCTIKARIVSKDLRSFSSLGLRQEHDNLCVHGHPALCSEDTYFLNRGQGEEQNFTKATLCWAQPFPFISSGFLNILRNNCHCPHGTGETKLRQNGQVA